MTPKTKTLIATGQQHITTVALRHPLNDCPAVATRKRYYWQNGRAVGLVLQFADGHTASLSYEEIRELQRVDDASL